MYITMYIVQLHVHTTMTTCYKYMYSRQVSKYMYTECVCGEREEYYYYYYYYYHYCLNYDTN